MSETKRIVEIEGVKVEVDLRTAKRVDELRVGSKVKVLDNTGYSGSKVHPGVVVGFEPFEKMPTIVVAYLDIEYSKAELKFLHFNKKSTEKYEIVAAVDDVIDFDREMTFSYIAREIAKHEHAIADLNEKRAYFERHFAQYWQQVAPIAEPEVPDPAPVDDNPF